MPWGCIGNCIIGNIGKPIGKNSISIIGSIIGKGKVNFNDWVWTRYPVTISALTSKEGPAISCISACEKGEQSESPSSATLQPSGLVRRVSNGIKLRSSRSPGNGLCKASSQGQSRAAKVPNVISYNAASRNSLTLSICFYFLFFLLAYSLNSYLGFPKHVRLHLPWNLRRISSWRETRRPFRRWLQMSGVKLTHS